MAVAFSLGTVFQYVVIAFLGYLLVGAPSFSDLYGSTPQRSASEKIENASPKTSALDNVVVPDRALTSACRDHGYKTHIFHRDPLIIYIEDFLSADEMEHVVKISEKEWKPSSVWTAGKERLDETVRKSEKAGLDEADQVVACISERARRFQGWRPSVFIEKMWSQRYMANGHYMYHYDYSNPSATSGRISSFMAYLEANCTGGGTNFPRLERPAGEDWCRFIECGKEGEKLTDGAGGEVKGVTFKAVKGNAVFWENMRSDGTGYPETYHAGLPVKEGVKIGLNIWSWFQEGYRHPGHV